MADGGVNGGTVCVNSTAANTVPEIANATKITMRFLPPRETGRMWDRFGLSFSYLSSSLNNSFTVLFSSSFMRISPK